MIEFNENTAILKTAMSTEYGGYEIILWSLSIWSPMRLEPLSNILKQLMVMLKNLSKRMENKR